MKTPSLLLSICLVASAGPAHADQQDDLLRAASWCATSARVVRGWHEHALPLPYARRTLKIAVDQLQDLDRTFADRDDEARRRLAPALDAVRRARETVERQDTGSVAARAAELDRQSEALAAKR